MRTTEISIQEINSYRYQTRTGEHGEIFYRAPIEILSKADLDNYHISRNDCRTIHFGGTDRRLVYFFETPIKALADEQWRTLNREHFFRVTADRCLIPGEVKALKRCHTDNSCARCPYGLDVTNKQQIIVSWEQLMETAEKKLDDAGTGDLTAEAAEFDVLLDEMQEVLDKKDTRLMQVIRLKFQRKYTAQDMADELGCSLPRIYQLLKQALKMAGEFLGEE